jgi:hypothetical protein
MKLWEVVVSDKVEPEIRKKIKRLLKPTHTVARPQNCLFCGVDTTWTINDKPVCPKCAVEYKFLGEQWLLDPCEVCGKQGEWATASDPQHFLCYTHRDEWFHWEIPELEFIDSKKQPDKWDKVWEEGWSKFVAYMKEEETKHGE